MLLAMNCIKQHWISLCLHKHTMKFLWWIHFRVFCELVAPVKLCSLCALLHGTRTTLLWVVKIKTKKILSSELFLAFTKYPFSLYNIMVAFSFNHSRGVFLTSPLLGTLNLSLVTPLSIAYSIVVGKVRTHVGTWLSLHHAPLTIASFPGLGPGNEATLTNEHKVRKGN